MFVARRSVGGIELSVAMERLRASSVAIEETVTFPLWFVKAIGIVADVSR